MCVNECTYVYECTNVCLLLYILHMYVCIFMYTCVDVMCMCTYVVHVCPLCSITLVVCLLLCTSRPLSIGRLLLFFNIFQLFFQLFRHHTSLKHYSIYFLHFERDFSMIKYLDDMIRSWRLHVSVWGTLAQSLADL